MTKSKGKNKKKLNKSEQMARVKNKNTALELMLRKELWAKGFRYRIAPRLPGTPDIAFMKRKVAVFIDGCFWHGCPVHYTKPIKNADFWEMKLTRNVTRDIRVNKELQESGWTVIRIWGHEVSDNVTDAANRVISALKS